jgi:hypothetical protein
VAHEPVARDDARMSAKPFSKWLEAQASAIARRQGPWRDKRRDNANAAQGIVTLRFGLLDLGDRSCQTAADVAAVLRMHGWTGDARPCSRPTCALRTGTS